MPRRPSLHFGTSASPNHSTNSVNEVVAAISRKLTSSHLDNRPPSPSPRRSSFSMDSILHPNREKKRPDSKDRHANEKRMSLVGIKAGKGTKSTESSPRLAPVRSGKFEIIIESGPLVSYGSAANSTGALLSGRLKLVVDDPSGQLTLNKLSLTFRAVIYAKKPIGKDCPDCKERHEVLKKEILLSEPRTFKQNEDHQFPFSHLFEGHLPATTIVPLGSITYQIVATGQSSTGEKIEVIHPITIERAITPGPEKSSIRIFPPTNLTARITLPSVVHPIGIFPIQMTLSGVVEKKNDLTTRWRLRKVLWHVDEAVKMISKPCSQHANKVKEGKALQHSDSRVVGQDDLKNGWKTDFDTAGGEIHLAFEAALGTKHNTRPVCDVTSPAGLEVKHPAGPGAHHRGGVRVAAQPEHHHAHGLRARAAHAVHPRRYDERRQ